MMAKQFHGVLTAPATAANQPCLVIPKHPKSLPLHLENNQVNRWDPFHGFFFAEPMKWTPRLEGILSAGRFHRNFCGS